LDLVAEGSGGTDATGSVVLADRGMSGRALAGVSRLAQHSPLALDRIARIDFSSGQVAAIVPADYTVVNSLCVSSPAFKQSRITLHENSVFRQF
jgi:hypothetical protein